MGRFKRFLAILKRLLRRNPPALPQDPFVWSPAPVTPRPRRPAGSVAVAEPDDD